jgi:hypothetical protein
VLVSNQFAGRQCFKEESISTAHGFQGPKRHCASSGSSRSLGGFGSPRAADIRADKEEKHIGVHAHGQYAEDDEREARGHAISSRGRGLAVGQRWRRISPWPRFRPAWFSGRASVCASFPVGMNSGMPSPTSDTHAIWARLFLCPAGGPFACCPSLLSDLALGASPPI